MRKMINEASRQFEILGAYADPDSVLVYQMGKVGSSTVKKVLTEAGIRSFHVHTFEGHVEPQIYSDNRHKAFIGLGERIAYGSAMKLRGQVWSTAGHGKEKKKIITLIRDPVATVLSRYFQDLHLHLVGARQSHAVYHGQKRMIEHLSRDLRDVVNFDYFENWFERELFAKTGLSFNCIEDYGDGSFIFENERYRVLLLKSERLTSSIETIGRFVGKQLPQLNRSSNSADEKWYGSIYDRFMKDVGVEFLFPLYEWEAWKKVYSSEEVSAFKSRWRSKGCCSETELPLSAA